VLRHRDLPINTIQTDRARHILAYLIGRPQGSRSEARQPIDD
jgi:hypothetical protein